MDDDQVLAELRLRVAAAPRSYAPATRAAIEHVEACTALVLPTFYRRLLTEVANGGFGPGYGIMGLPPYGYAEEEIEGGLVESYLEGRRCDVPSWRTPRGLLHLCNWGCGTFSMVDTLSPDAAVITECVHEDGIDYVETSPSLASWLERWLTSADENDLIYTVTGHREGINPFTGNAMQIPIRHLRGTPLDVSDRM